MHDVQATVYGYQHAEVLHSQPCQAACELDAMLNLTLSSETGHGSQQRVAVKAQQHPCLISCCAALLGAALLASV